MVNFSDKINGLFNRDEWDKARRLLENELQKDPINHWLLTQLGVTFYEQRRYKDALRFFVRSRAIVADCPLTLWNLAGALDAIGKPRPAITIYNWILQAETTSHDDPCWESAQWTEALKADAVFRLGICFEHLGRKNKAEDLYRRYLEFLLKGAEGTYSVEEVTRKIRSLHEGGKGWMKGEFKQAADAAARISGRKPRKRPASIPPSLGKRELAVSPRAVAKK